MDRKPFASGRFLLLSLFLLSGLAAACRISPSQSSGAKSSRAEGQKQFLPYDNTLAVSKQMRAFTLPLNNPGVVPAKMASHMEPEDVVVGVVVNQQPRAYPRWILVKYHVVNDTVGNEAVMVAHCEVCSGASAFRPVIDQFGENSLVFDTYGTAKGTFSVYDYQTHSVWSPFTGKTLEGALHPSRLERVPVMIERWETWMKRFPDTDVVFASRMLIEQHAHGTGEDNEIGAEHIPQGFQKDDRGRSWNEFGRATDRQGKDLAVADGYFTEWYEWVSSYPQSEIAK